ncbi:hypothetical protein BCR35DRAFT_145263 [Leucosporidium creatinivorum]|uniref:Uncharacterized protein n=1 Tax=Leucosporidium creatinivorum TaxID=106004 RepID=A0A1Y2ERC3_9BASI|nr:hypothetical protein BCR35DRAFT_145263 [Leucosporidium creatinivorum]
MAHSHPSPSPPPPPHPFTSTASPPQPSPLSPLHADLLAKLHLEQAIADGAENLLAVFQAEEQQQLQDGSQTSNKHDLKLQVERELQGARSRIAELEERIQRLIEQEQPLASPSLNGTSNGVHSPNSITSSEYYHYAAGGGDRLHLPRQYRSRLCLPTPSPLPSPSLPHPPTPPSPKPKPRRTNPPSAQLSNWSSPSFND